MGLGDKLKGLTKQAQDAVAEHRDQIQDAVGVAGAAVDRKTRGKHTAKIAKMGQKAEDAIDRFTGDDEDGAAGTQPPSTPPPAGP